VSATPRKKITFDDPAVLEPPPPTPESPPAPPAPRHTTRIGKRGVQVWLSPAAYRQLRLIAAREDLQIQDCLTEAIDMFFQSRGEHRIAKS
jgi:hypothetical protein